jgi:hypothetical protein
MIIGIDPGLQGAVTFLTDYSIQVKDLIHCIDVTGNFHSLDPCLFRDFIEISIIGDNDVSVFCEESILIPGNGIKTSRIVYDSRGVLRAVFELRGIPINWVAPITWKSCLGLRNATKEDSIKKIIEIFPEYNDLYYKIKGDKTYAKDGRAESTLIALYGKQFLQQKNYEKSTPKKKRK